jgi:hypothetical protein
MVIGCAEIKTMDKNLSRLRPVKPDQILEQRRFAAAASTDYDKYLSFTHPEMDIIKNPVVTVSGAQSLNFDDFIRPGCSQFPTLLVATVKKVVGLYSAA